MPRKPGLHMPENQIKNKSSYYLIDSCLQELSWIHYRHDLSEAQKDFAQWLKRWQKKYSKLCAWVEESIGETFNYSRLPDQHAGALQRGDQTKNSRGSHLPECGKLSEAGSGFGGGD
jgi:transposase-like protein